MKKSSFLALILLLTAAPVLAAEAAPPLVSPMFGDHMVLQRGQPDAVWGWAKPGDEIQVTFAGRRAHAVAGPDGRWETKIDPPAPGGPYTLKISGPQAQVEFHDVLVGDVWLCGGQSNMELGLGRAENGAAEIQAATHPDLRLFIVPHQVAYTPAATLPGARWKICSPQSVASGGWEGFSAVAYYFGRRLQADLHVPVGLVEDCWGGTPAEAWTSAESLRAVNGFAAPLAALKRLQARGGTAYGNYIMPWYDEYDVGEKQHWFAADFDDARWRTVKIPGGFQELGVPATPAVCWFRREIVLPSPLPPGAAKISLGVIERMDTTYINGQ